MNERVTLAIFLSALVVMQCSPVAAETDSKADLFAPAQPAWTSKIPKGRYPCICDPPMLDKAQQVKLYKSGESVTEVVIPSTEETISMMDSLSSKLKQTITGQPYPDDLCCEIQFRMTQERQLLGFVTRGLTADKAFNAAVFQAIYLSCDHKQPMSDELPKKQIEYRFFFTPKNVFLKDPYPNKVGERKMLGPLRIRERREPPPAIEDVQKNERSKPKRYNDIQKFLDGTSRRLDGYDAVDP
ncbi:MAG TPA: hypothetical protein EYN91_25540 [Candidatus Melainabacteria bacterium]|nr:hypothetical protein [Candidatus Melainabacteria bacterium]HIN66918.1 hypothetical protein [Candidatus Obscuribacterales bacterium]